MNVKVFQLAKRESGSYERIQDKYAVTGDCIAIADGATQSFKPDLWADLLVHKYSARPALTRESFKSFIREAGAEFNSRDFTLSVDPLIALLEKKALSRGGYAAFLGARINREERELDFISYGDCLLIVSEKGKVTFYPFSSIEELRSGKNFLPSANVEDNFEEEAIRQGTISFAEDTRLYFVTDALGEYLFKHQEAFAEIDSWASFEQFSAHVLRRWESGEIEDDDITLVCLEPAKPFRLCEFLPPSGAPVMHIRDRVPDRVSGEEVAGWKAGGTERESGRGLKRGGYGKAVISVALVLLFTAIVAVFYSTVIRQPASVKYDHSKVRPVRSGKVQAVEQRN